MGFNASLNKARDISLPIPKRYMALLGALERGHRSFHYMWTVLQEKFGVRIGDQLSSGTLCAIADFLAEDRQEWHGLRKEGQDPDRAG